jgi:hypothetical protein
VKANWMRDSVKASMPDFPPPGKQNSAWTTPRAAPMALASAIFTVKTVKCQRSSLLFCPASGFSYQSRKY